MRKRVSSLRRAANLALSAVLALGLVPVAAFAQDSGETSPLASGAFGAAGESNLQYQDDQALSLCAVLYSDGTLAFQENSQQLPGLGAVVKSWTVDPNEGFSGNAPWFADRMSVASVSFASDAAPVSLARWFKGMANLEQIDLSGLDAASVQDISEAFSGCSSLLSLDLSGLDGSQVVLADDALSGCPQLESLTLPAGLNLAKSLLRDALWKDSTGATFGSTAEMFAANAAREQGMQTYSLASLTSEWNQSGTCEWRVDTSGELLVRPLGGGTSGTLASWKTDEGAPWYALRESITSVRFEQGVAAQTCQGMFAGCSQLASVDLAGLDTSAVTDASSLFKGCWMLESVDLSKIDMANVKNAADMFYACSSLVTLTLPAGAPLSGSLGHDIAWKDTAGHTYIGTSDMLAANAAQEAGASTYSSLAAAGWLPSGTCEWRVSGSGELVVRPLAGAASGSLGNWSTCEGVPWYSQRQSITAVTLEPGVAAKTCCGLFYGCANLASIDLGALDTYGVEDMTSMFSGCSSLSDLDLTPLDASRVLSMQNMFSGCSSLSVLDLTPLDISKVAQVEDMLLDCSSLRSITLPAGLNLARASLHDDGWRDAAGVAYSTTQKMLVANAARETGAQTYTGTTLGWTHLGTCEWRIDADGVLVIRPLGGVGTGELGTWRSYDTVPWYNQRTDITAVRVEQGVTATVCWCMFSGCSNLVSVDLSELDLSKIIETRNMFKDCTSLETIWTSGNIEAASLIGRRDMFAGCTSLVGGMGTVFDPAYTGVSRARIDGGSDAPGYFTKKRESWEGDVNANGVVNLVDAQIAYDIATTSLYENRSDYAEMCRRADVTGDGAVHAEDAFAIQYLALCGSVGR